MPRPKNTVPRFCVDASGRAFTKVDGKFKSLGLGDNPESRKRYAALLTDIANGKALVSFPVTTPNQRAEQRRMFHLA